MRINTGDQSVTLVASAAKTADSTGETAYTLPCPVGGILFILDLTAAATAVDDTLDVFVQTKIGSEWVDVVHFTQILGNGGAKRYYAKISATEPQAMFEDGSALAAAAIRHLCGEQFRARWTITDAGADNASFTFSLKALAM